VFVLMIDLPDLPLPGHGATAERLRRLAALGRADLVACRLAEGHVDAMAIRAELGDADPSRDPGGRRWGSGLRLLRPYGRSTAPRAGG